VLDAGAAVELEVLLDLALALSLGGLVDRELETPVAAHHHLAHERRVLGGDRFVGEVSELTEAETALVELHPVVHAPELDVADDVIDQLQADAERNLSVSRLDRAIARKVWAGIVLAVDEGVDRLAVGPDGRELDAAVLVLEPARLVDSARSALERLAVCLGCVRDAEGDVLDAVPVHVRMACNLVVGPQRARDDEASVALFEHIRGAVSYPCLRPRVRHGPEAECVLVEVGGLLGVPDPELDVVPAEQRHEVLLHRRNSTAG
jgi:hypothetical protein